MSRGRLFDATGDMQPNMLWEVLFTLIDFKPICSYTFPHPKMKRSATKCVMLLVVLGLVKKTKNNPKKNSVFRFGKSKQLAFLEETMCILDSNNK